MIPDAKGTFILVLSLLVRVYLRELMAGGGSTAGSADIASLLIHGILTCIHVITGDVSLSQTVIIRIGMIGILTVHSVGHGLPPRYSFCYMKRIL